MNINSLIQNAESSIRFRDADGIIYEINSGRKNGIIEFRQNVIKNVNGIAEFNLEIKNISDKTLFIDEVAVLDVSSKEKGTLALGGNINSWTMLSAGLGVGVKDLCNPCHNENKLDYYSPYYSLLGSRKTGKYVFLGFLTFAGQHTEIRLKAVKGFKFESLKAVCQFCGLPLTPGDKIQTETLYVNAEPAGIPSLMIEKYFDLIAARIDKSKVNFKDIIGWATWDYYQDKISESDILENLDWLAARRNTIPVEYIQLDAGFSDCEGEWLTTNKKFPHGLKWLAAEIKSKGFKPGLWLCPFLAAPQSRVCREHPDWVIKTADGSPLEVAGYAVKTVYALDCSIPEVCDWIRELARTVTVDYGFEYIKLDGANGQGMSPLGILAASGVSTGKAMRNGLKAFKEGMKEGTFLLNACLFGLSLGVADGMRIGDDVGGRWDGSKIAKHHGERDSFNGPGEVLRAIAATLNHGHQHKKLWINDPDYLVVRQQGSNSELSYEEAQSWASVVSLSNGLVMLSDKLPELALERVKLLEKALPHYKHAAVPLDFFRKNVPSFYALKVENKSEEWQVICIINVDYPAREREYILDFQEAGLAVDKEYHIFDFWRSEYKGVFSNCYKVSLPPHCCQLVAVREKQSVPQVLATDIHITCGGLEIESSQFKDNTLAVKTANLGRIGNIFVFVPDEFVPDSRLIKHAVNVWKSEVRLDGGTVNYIFTKNCPAKSCMRDRLGLLVS
ncbi:MAG: glycoside hydrolase family 36 protein [Victivallaceae bacterium]